MVNKARIQNETVVKQRKVIAQLKRQLQRQRIKVKPMQQDQSKVVLPRELLTRITAQNMLTRLGRVS